MKDELRPKDDEVVRENERLVIWPASVFGLWKTGWNVYIIATTGGDRILRATPNKCRARYILRFNSVKDAKKYLLKRFGLEGKRERIPA